MQYFGDSTFLKMSSADDQYEQQNDVTGGDVPAGNPSDNSYTSRSGRFNAQKTNCNFADEQGQYQIPVQKDSAPVEDPINPATADTNETLGNITI